MSDDNRWFYHADSATLGDYTVLLYQTWEGDRTDIQTTIVERIAVFDTEKLDEIAPSEDPDCWSSAGQMKNIRPFTWGDKSTERYRHSYSRSSFDGLDHAISDDTIATIQKADREAANYSSLQEDNEFEYIPAWRKKEGEAAKKTSYGNFLDRIEEVDPDNYDDPVWEQIRGFMDQRAAQMENV